MKTKWVALVCGAGKAFALHPASSLLQAYRDQALPAGQRQKIAGHLRECPTCRLEVKKQEEVLEWFRSRGKIIQEEEPQVLPQGLRKIQEAIRAYTFGSTDNGIVGEAISYLKEELKERTLSELQYYLGKGTVQTLLSQSKNPSEEIPDLLMNSEPLLAAFLGRKAAVHIYEKISMAGGI